MARAITGNPRVLLLDESLEGLDGQERGAVRDLIRRYQGTVLMATNDPDDIGIADLVWRLEDGRLAPVQTQQEYLDEAWLERGGMAWHEHPR